MYARVRARNAAAQPTHTNCAYASDGTVRLPILRSDVHGHAVCFRVDTPSHLGVPSSEWSFDDALRIDGEAGDTVLFHIDTLHGSTPNRSPLPRPVYIHRYLESGDYQTYFATDARMRERAKLAYEADVRVGRRPIKERGFMVRGRRVWSEEVEWKLNVKVNH